MQMKPGEASAGGRNRRVFGDMVEKKYGFFGIWTGGKKDKILYRVWTLGYSFVCVTEY